MLGGGQLGRMAAQSASRLGLQVITYDPNPDSPAFQICARSICADWHDENALKNFATQVDVITYEFENVPIETLAILEELRPIFPKANLLEIAQHRLSEKTFLNETGLPTARFQAIAKAEDITQALQSWGSKQAVLKTCRMGYDGKGQRFIQAEDDLQAAIQSLNSNDLILEDKIDFDCEISVIVARDSFGTAKTYPPSLNEHKDHILHKTTAPAPIGETIKAQAQDLALKLANKIDLIGVLAIEFFVTKNGQLLANEIAPRPHNSGHWTIDACHCSQFEQQIRAVAGLPLGSTDPHSNAEMTNLLGEDVLIAQEVYETEACIHIYGKKEIKAGRKMGHITKLNGPWDK